MQKILFILSALLFFTQNASSKRPEMTYLDEMYGLGSVSGQGLACKSQKYHQFELLARAIMIGKATDDEIQKKAMERYTIGKVEAFANIESHNFEECADILPAFEGQRIFKSVLYSDGRLKFDDGTMITPRKPYDASKLYVKDREAFIKADAIYKKSLAEAQKNMQNAEKIELHDSNYARFANEFN